MPIRLVVADNHPLILNALKQFFTPEEGFEIIACCQDGEETLQAVRSYQPDVLIQDIKLLIDSRLALTLYARDTGLV